MSWVSRAQVWGFLGGSYDFEDVVVEAGGPRYGQGRYSEGPVGFMPQPGSTLDFTSAITRSCIMSSDSALCTWLLTIAA